MGILEQAAFEAWLGSLGRTFVRRNASNWFGSAETKPTYCASWVEAQWMGWQARAVLGGAGLPILTGPAAPFEPSVAADS